MSQEKLQTMIMQNLGGFEQVENERKNERASERASERGSEQANQWTNERRTLNDMNE